RRPGQRPEPELAVLAQLLADLGQLVERPALVRFGDARLLEHLDAVVEAGPAGAGAVEHAVELAIGVELVDRDLEPLTPVDRVLLGVVVERLSDAERTEPLVVHLERVDEVEVADGVTGRHRLELLGELRRREWLPLQLDARELLLEEIADLGPRVVVGPAADVEPELARRPARRRCSRLGRAAGGGLRRGGATGRATHRGGCRGGRRAGAGSDDWSGDRGEGS